MFSNLFGGGDNGGSSKEGGTSEPSTSQLTDKSQQGGLPFDIWGVASAVTNSVKARADELVKSVKQTDWKAELLAFSKEAAEETKTLSHKTAELVEHLPEAVEQLPERAERVAAQIPRIAHNAEVAETLGSISKFGKSLLVGTKELIEQVKDAVESEIAQATKETKRSARGAKAGTSAQAKLGPVVGRYNRFEAEVAAMQRDSATYVDEPEDAADYAGWRAGFSLADKKSEIDSILATNSFMAELQSRIVPLIVEHDDFWTRYFYRLYKLQQREEQRSQLTQRAAQALKEEEDVAWDDDDLTSSAPVETPKASTPAEGWSAAEVPSTGSSPVKVSSGDDGPVPVKDTASSTPSRGSPLGSPASGRAAAGGAEDASGDSAGVAATSAATAAPSDTTAAATSIHTAEQTESEPEVIGADASSDSSGKGEWCVLTTAGDEPTPAGNAGSDAPSISVAAQNALPVSSPASAGPAPTPAAAKSTGGPAGAEDEDDDENMFAKQDGDGNDEGALGKEDEEWSNWD